MIPLEPLSSVIRWQDILDILLNSYILFRLYVLFRGTHVIRVVAGLVLLWLFQRVATQMGLIVTSWAMQGIIAAAALIVIIVFRNEIRNVLQAQNLRAILWGFPKKNIQTPVDILTESVSDLSRRRIGALIILPGKEDLRDMVQGGVNWQGLISKEMLLSIFWNGNPVHDGAAVIEGNRIARVGTILPLSQRQDLPQRFGTRHRAALGLAQNSDAMVIVVSEETGNIIVAKGHEIIDIHDNQVLRYNIRKHLGIGLEPPKGVKRETIELSIAGLLCLICMTFIWFSFTRGMETLTTMEMPVEFVNRASGLEIFDTSASTAKLYLSGSGALIKNMRSDQVKVTVDLSRADIGANVFNLNSKNVSLPPGIHLNRIEPSVLTVTLDKLTTKVIPIQVNWVGEMPGGMLLKSAEVSPSTVKVVGASQRLAETPTIYTEPVRLGRLEASGTFNAKLILEPASLQVAEGAEDRVKVTYVMQSRSP
ncbi:MAG TPA: diadenylate cyclase [Desulfosalsimonadaceae bacterium]|nr:diadenylate cyclase [Desulfosalsimonadaceae bacterium]